MFNRNKFRAKMVEMGISSEELARILGINRATLYRKTVGISEFTRDEIQTLSQVLHLTMQEVKDIFFADKITET